MQFFSEITNYSLVRPCSLMSIHQFLEVVCFRIHVLQCKFSGLQKTAGCNSPHQIELLGCKCKMHHPCVLFSKTFLSPDTKGKCKYATRRTLHYMAFKQPCWAACTRGRSSQCGGSHIRFESQGVDHRKSSKWWTSETCHFFCNKINIRQQRQQAFLFFFCFFWYVHSRGLGGQETCVGHDWGRKRGRFVFRFAASLLRRFVYCSAELSVFFKKEQEDLDAGHLINFVEDLDYDECAQLRKYCKYCYSEFVCCGNAGVSKNKHAQIARFFPLGIQIFQFFPFLPSPFLSVWVQVHPRLGVPGVSRSHHGPRQAAPTRTRSFQGATEKWKGKRIEEKKRDFEEIRRFSRFFGKMKPTYFFPPKSPSGSKDSLLQDLNREVAAEDGSRKRLKRKEKRFVFVFSSETQWYSDDF